MKLHPMDYLGELQTAIHPLMQKIAHHPLYDVVSSLETLAVMSEHHIYAVWDFMCLLKALQGRLTCVTIPWFPPSDSLGAHLINGILAEEEGDIASDNHYLSHFELYLEAMQQCGASTQGISQFLAELKAGKSLEEAIKADYIPACSRDFVRTTFKLITKTTHEIAAAFVFGREDITAKMFYPLVSNLDSSEQAASKFMYYFKRHIELDGSSHAPKGYQLMMNLCGQDLQKWQETRIAAEEALLARIRLLDGMHQAIINYVQNQSSAQSLAQAV